MAGFAPDPIRFRHEAAGGWLALTTLLLVSCGGGGGGGSQSPTPLQAASFSYPSPPAYVVRTAIAPLTPAVTGGLSGFTDVSGLPPGLVIDSGTGVISGRPTTARKSSNYTISANAPSGQTVTTVVNLTVDAVGPGTISYGASAFTFTAGIPGRALTPKVYGPVTGWSIAPQLPPGLAFDTVSGSISGTPTAASPRTAYTVSALGSPGMLSVTFAIEVDTDVLVDLGHNAQIWSLQFNGSTVLSEDVIGHWVLWNYSTGAMIASGDAGAGNAGCIYGGCTVSGAPAALAGATAVIRTATGLQVRSAATGALMANISTTLDWWSLATDGSYIVAGDITGLSVWSPSGQLLISRPGNYAGAITYAAPGAIRMGNGAAGANVVETVSVPTGTHSMSAQFQGQFTSWFLDGSGFLSTVFGTGATKLLAYSNSIVQEASLTNPPVNWGQAYGQGPWLSTVGSGAVTAATTVSVYALASPTTPVATYSFGVDAATMTSASTIAVWDPDSAKLSVIDLSGAAPVKVDYASPLGISHEVSTYAAASGSQWITGDTYGVLLDGASLSGTPRYFGYGEAYSVAANANRIAIATASGRILYFNAVTLAQEGTIPLSSQLTYAEFQSVGQATNPQVALSSDGSILAVMEPGGFPLNIYSLPSGSLVYSWPYTPSGSLYSLPLGISLSGSGTVLGVTTVYAPVPGNFTQTATVATGGAPLFSSNFISQGSSTPPLRISPDGTQIATSTWGNPDVVQQTADYETNIVRNSVVVPFVPGWPVGWIDDTHLLVNGYVQDTVVSGTQGDYAGCTIYDLSGTPTGTCALPEVLGFQVLNSDTLYVLNQPAMVSVSTGAVSWMSGDNLPWFAGYMMGPSFNDALAGNHVVLVSDSRLVAQSY